MSLQQDLIAARAVIADPAHWTRHALARTSARNEVWPTDETATCWCLGGAILKVIEAPKYRDFGDRFRIAREYLNREFGDGDMPDAKFKNFGAFNDKHTHSELLAWLDRKIDEVPAEMPQAA